MGTNYENKGAFAATVVVAASDSLNRGAANYVCDGVNDEVEIQAAIDALPAYVTGATTKKAGRIILSEGIFHISNTINVDGDITIEGQMMPMATYTMGTCIVNGNVAGANAFHLLSPIALGDHTAKIVLKNMSIRGNAASGHGVYADNVHFVLDNIVLEANGGDGVFVEACWGGSILNSDIRDNFGSGVSYNDNAGAEHCTFQLIDHSNIGSNLSNAGIYMPDYTAELVVRACYFEHGADIGAIHHIRIGGGSNVVITDGCRLAITQNAAAYPIYVFNGGQVKITNSIIGGGAARAIEISTGISTEIIGNVFMNWTTFGIWATQVAAGSVLIDDNYFMIDKNTFPDQTAVRFSGNDNSSITNNRVICSGVGNNQTLIHLDDSDYCTISNNIIKGSYKNAGIKLEPGDHCTIIGNVIENMTGYGIVITGTSTNNTISGNAVANCGTRGIYLDPSTFRNICKGNTLFNNVANFRDYGTDGTNVVDQAVHSISLDLSGGAVDIEAFFAASPCVLAGYSILYTEASSADAGVNIRIGRYQSGVALDDDYFDISVSEVSKALGYSKNFITTDLTQSVIAAGDTVTVGTAGGKVGTGEVLLILRIVETG